MDANISEKTPNSRLRLIFCIGVVFVIGNALVVASQVLELTDIPIVRVVVNKVFGEPEKSDAPPDTKKPSRPKRAEVTVAVDRDDRTYIGGDDLHLTVTSDQPGYVHLFAKSELKRMLVYPKANDASNSIAAHKQFRWSMKAKAPYGERELWAVVTHEPLRLSDIQGKQGELSKEQIKRLYAELKTRDVSHGWQWAEAKTKFEVIDPE
ncbi:MAG: hypothetical protein ACFCD0_14255 [Gemmataceae bacterium]